MIEPTADDAIGQAQFAHAAVAGVVDLDRAARRRGARILAKLCGPATGFQVAKPMTADAAKLTGAGVVYLTVSREPVDPTFPAHWHVAISEYADGHRQAVGVEEFAAWIAAGWRKVAGLDTYVMATVGARHALIPLSFGLPSS